MAKGWQKGAIFLELTRKGSDFRVMAIATFSEYGYLLLMWRADAVP